MTDAFYEDLRDNTVKPLLDEFGFSMILVTSREPTIDPNTGAITAASADVQTPVTGLFRFFSQDEIFKALEAGQTIQANDLQALIEAKSVNDAGIDIDTVTQLIAKSVTYNVVRNWPTQPGGIPLLYKLQVRR